MLVNPFMVIVKVINIDDLINRSEIATLGKGGLGSIIAQNDGNEQLVAKRIKFQRKLQLKNPSTKQFGYSLEPIQKFKTH
jgi:hypothetical protein